VDFYREQFSAAIDTNALEKFKKDYQGSVEEERDVLAAFDTYKGDLDRVYESVMLSNVLDDDIRFRAIIDKAIAEERVEAYGKYTEEPEKKREQRWRRAQKEAKEAEKLAKKLEKEKEGKGSKAGPRKGKKESTSTMDNSDLAALIQQRQTSRAESFFDRLEAKYNPSGKKRVATDEPPEEAFQATAARRSSKKTKSKTKT
jgi:DnaJ family protein C protein 9